MIQLHVNEDNNIYWRGLKRESDDTYVDDATVTFTLKTKSGGVVADAEDVTMVYMEGSDGDYIGVLSNDIPLVAGARYVVEMTALIGSSKGFRKLQCEAVYHGASCH